MVVEIGDVFDYVLGFVGGVFGFVFVDYYFFWMQCEGDWLVFVIGDFVGDIDWCWEQWGVYCDVFGQVFVDDVVEQVY